MPNLCDLPQAERDEIEADKDRWHQCHVMLFGVKGFGGEMKKEPLPRREIDRFIRQQPSDQQQDWRDRLNQMKSGGAHG